MKQFFKFMFASMLGIFLSLFILFLVGGGILAGIASSASEDKEPAIKASSILHLKLNKQIKDRSSDNPFETFNFATLEDESPLTLKGIIENIEKASKDERIDGIYLNLKSLRANLSSLEAIRRSLESFKESGKFIIAYSESYGQAEYYLSSVADEIYLNPAGGITFKGLSAQLMFFKDALERIDIDMQVIRHGKFKSAIEPFIRNDMSAENEAQLKRLIQGVWDTQWKAIAKSRSIDGTKLNQIADDLLIRTADDALAYGMVDGLKYEDEVKALLIGKSNLSKSETVDQPQKNTDSTAVASEIESEDREEKTDPALNLLSLNDLNKLKYAQGEDKDVIREKRKSRDRIAVIYAEGEIVSGKSDADLMGSETMVEAIREAREDDKVKAIVLRVNSPGGSALASEVIWRETTLAREEKPLVVSMGDLAASGGYYISCGADKIFAERSTITGSIGVFGVIPNMQGLLNEKMGIYVDQVNSNRNADGLTPFRPLNETERSAVRDMIETIYDDFTSKVAVGRNMSQANVDSIGQGRVWNGMDALEIGLVDELGGLEAAINHAAEMADLEHYKLKELPKRQDPMMKLMKEFANQSYVKILGLPMQTKAEKYYRVLERTFETEGIYTRLPVDIIFN